MAPCSSLMWWAASGRTLGDISDVVDKKTTMPVDLVVPWWSGWHRGCPHITNPNFIGRLDVTPEPSTGKLLAVRGFGLAWLATTMPDI